MRRLNQGMLLTIIMIILLSSKLHAQDCKDVIESCDSALNQCNKYVKSLEDFGAAKNRHITILEEVKDKQASRIAELESRDNYEWLWAIAGTLVGGFVVYKLKE